VRLPIKQSLLAAAPRVKAVKALLVANLPPFFSQEATARASAGAVLRLRHAG
jgi:hypothetical protein